MKKITQILLILFITNLSFSQITKTFKGNYKNGKATFQYYDGIQKDIILNGKFSFTKDNTITESGEFVNNLKNGKWVYTYRENKDLIKINGLYKNDLKDGLWSFNLYEEGLKKEYILNFKKDTIIGKINIVGLQGEFSTNGKYIGDWIIDHNGYLSKAKFIDNILIYMDGRSTKSSTNAGRYQPDIYKIDFLNLSDKKNGVERKKYDIDFIKRTENLDVSKIYGVSNFEAEYKQDLFNYFFSSIVSNIKDDVFRHILNWSYLKEFELINNPDVLYKSTQRNEIAKIEKNKREEFEEIYGSVIESSQVEEKPDYIGGFQKFIDFLSRNYNF